MKQVYQQQEKLGNRVKTGFKQWLVVLPFLGIPLFLFLVFVLYPQIKNVYIAVTDYSIMPGAEAPFVGLKNFRRIFTSVFETGSDANYFWLSFRNSLLAVVVTVPGQLIFGILAAVMINQIKFAKGFYKVVFYIAVICDWVVVCNIFDYIFQPDKGGLVNFTLMNLHLISEPVAWFSNTWTANAVVWIVSIWKGFGWVMIIYLAALTGVPKDLYEVAKIDGAGFWMSFFAYHNTVYESDTHLSAD